ncbi:MAG: (2Fe-2S)-binding protein [Candidatus Bipolaricaulota bacterium]
MDLEITVNGKHLKRKVDGNKRLIDFLREELGFTGVKEGCGVGECGACTVLIDGESVLSCLIRVAQVNGKEILTVEGLSKGGDLHPVQQAFVETGGVQCGFCTPGFIMVAVELLERNPDPSREEIREYIEGNICRCTGYVKIVDAIELAAERMRKGEEKVGT